MGVDDDDDMMDGWPWVIILYTPNSTALCVSRRRRTNMMMLD